jgi:tetratricopeptide (TPR) repeat protein
LTGKPPANADALFERALRLHQAGSLAEAQVAYRAILEADPAHAESLHLLGVIAYQTGQLEEARGLIEQALAINPAAPFYHSNLGLVLHAQDRPDEAGRHFSEAIRLLPAYCEAHNNLGLVLLKKEQFGDAADAFRRAIALKADFPEAHTNLGFALEKIGKIDEAIKAHQAAMHLKPDYAQAHNNLGIAFLGKGDAAGAIASYRRAIEAKPDYGDAYSNLGVALTQLGKFGEAVTAFEEAIELGADRATAFYGLSGCRKFTEADKALIGEMQAALTDVRTTEAGQSLLHFALGKAFDDLGDYAAAIRHFDQGNRIEAKTNKFSGTGFAGVIDRLIAAAQTNVAEISDSALPVLIVGMPRSGTTLVEQILASHPGIAAGGELNFWFHRLEDIREGRAPQLDDTASAIHDYLALLRSHGPQALRVTDKMPYNFLFLGIVHKLFPKARIIHCRRHPVDTALSIYFSRFTGAHPFAFDRGDIAAYYRHYLRAMDYWRSTLPPGRFLEIDYEDIIRDQETASRRLIAFCGLPWDDACLDFHRTDRSIATLSAWQARQPIYKSSVARRRLYEPWLGALRDLAP